MPKNYDDDYPIQREITVSLDGDEDFMDDAEITYLVDSWEIGQEVLEAMHDAARGNLAVVKKDSASGLDFKPV